MPKKNVDDYVQKGLYGVQDTKPEERKQFLGTLRERVVVALTQSQVRKTGTVKEVEELMKENPKARLYLNGNMNYTYLCDYMKLADTHHISYRMVTDKENETDLGLVLAYDTAIDKEHIYIEDKEEKRDSKGEEQKESFFSAIWNALNKK
ncbi:YueI family protein [Bacillus taeanensis]|uniref:DUF1694 domain-containing protein n=1 Tax=Bacillus taeanensis TaxID=273032 RepID=A0A366XVI0_9BACI|nr:YueI family protein [Bacillus taeanensis]RBW68163.1 DUF1694 domain-containing protein [Bacillus taeanensis]